MRGIRRAAPAQVTACRVVTDKLIKERVKDTVNETLESYKGVY